jgi:cobalt/nickel transport system permease protein
MSKSSNFIARSLMAVFSFLKDSVFAEDYAARQGLLQSLDPRVRIISFALLFITAVFLKKTEFLALLYALCLALAVLSRIDLGYFLKRTWIFIPFFSLCIALPAISSIFSPGITVATLKIFKLQLAITREGLQAAILFVSRVVVGVSYAVLLSLTMRHTALLRVLRIFGIPQIFIMTLGMCYRYIYLFVEIIENTYLAVKSRSGTAVHYKKGQKLVTWNIASLWQRSYVLSQEVYAAMLSRGYRGEPAVIDDFKAGVGDWVWLFLTGVFFAVLLYLNFMTK